MLFVINVITLVYLARGEGHLAFASVGIITKLALVHLPISPDILALSFLIVQVFTFEAFPTVPGKLAFSFFFAMDPFAFVGIAIHHSLLAVALSEVVKKVTIVRLSVRPCELAFAMLFTVR